MKFFFLISDCRETRRANIWAQGEVVHYGIADKFNFEKWSRQRWNKIRGRGRDLEDFADGHVGAEKNLETISRPRYQGSPQSIEKFRWGKALEKTNISEVRGCPKIRGKLLLSTHSFSKIFGISLFIYCYFNIFFRNMLRSHRKVQLSPNQNTPCVLANIWFHYHLLSRQMSIWFLNFLIILQIAEHQSRNSPHGFWSQRRLGNPWRNQENPPEQSCLETQGPGRKCRLRAVHACARASPRADTHFCRIDPRRT